jgi:UDPglucose 6-dehydrogenase/GDP-mannose 6-dehydrogenase
MKISIIGAGYVGLVTGVCLAEKGHQVVCVDIDEEKVEKINRAIPPFYERGLKELLGKARKPEFFATGDLHKSVMESEVSFIAVGTPFDGSRIDLKYVRDVARQIGTALGGKTSYHLVVLKSTVVPGTTDKVILPIIEEASGKRAGIDFGVCMNPEFLREGEAIRDFMFPDRIVIGGIDDRSIQTLERVFEAFQDVDKIRTNNKTAEMIKYTANSLLATMISFSNEIGNLCSRLGDVDVKDVMKGVHLDKRMSPLLSNGERVKPSFLTYLEAGCGFGGSCFPKDLKALISHGKAHSQSMELLESVVRVNERQPRQVVSLLKKHFVALKGRQITVLGLSFKPGTDDMRESPAIPVVRDLVAEKANVRAYDPVATEEARRIFCDLGVSIDFCQDLDQALKNAEAVIILTRWEEFTSIPDRLEQLGEMPLIVDGRRMLDKNIVKRYEGIGLSCNSAGH